MPLNIYNRLNIPNKNSPIPQKHGEFIYSFLKMNSIKKTLETGFGYGCSAAYIISATKSTHIVIDPFEKSQWKNIGLHNIKKLNLSKFLRFENDFSYNVLPKLLKEGIKIDFAFIDGMHLFDYIMLDFFYIDLLLNNNGYVLFHDNQLLSTNLIVNWIKKNKLNYTLIKEDSCFVLFKKIKADVRKWDHFIAFYNCKKEEKTLKEKLRELKARIKV